MRRLVSSAHLFAKRGDPWISPREGRSLFGRNLRTENPDMDMFTRAGRATKRFERGPDKPLSLKNYLATPQRRIANIVRGMNKRLHADHGLVIVPDSPPKPAPPVLKTIKTQGYTIYSVTIDGEEYEGNRQSLALAERVFDRLIKDRKTVLVELWDGKGVLLRSRRRNIRGMKDGKN